MYLPRRCPAIDLAFGLGTSKGPHLLRTGEPVSRPNDADANAHEHGWSVSAMTLKLISTALAHGAGAAQRSTAASTLLTPLKVVDAWKPANGPSISDQLKRQCAARLLEHVTFN